MEGVDKILEEVEEGVDAIKGTKFEGKFEQGAKGKESKKDGKEEEEEVWTIGLGYDSDPIEVTRIEYLAKNPSKRRQRPNPNMSGESWTPYGKG